VTARSKPRSPIVLFMRRGGTWLAAMGAVLALAACGGEDARPEEPTLRPGLAERLAEQSEAIADKLDAGDACGAAQEADILNNQAQAAIDAGEVPPAFQSELMSTVNELVNTVNCPQPPPPPPPEDCEALEEQKKALEEEKKDAEGAEKEQLEAQIKALEEEIKACKEGRGDGGDD
jgi:hypothetical protein